MLTQKDIAEVYRLGLTIGMFENKEVVAWADSIIAAEASPDYALIEVSMAGDQSEGKMATLLRDVGGDCDPKVAREVIYGLLGRNLAKDSGAAEAVAAQVKAIERGEGLNNETTADLAALQRFDARAAEWLAR